MEPKFMLKLNFLFLTAKLLFFTACGNSNVENSQSEEETQIVLEADSVSAELSASGDAVELKVNELQATMDSLNIQ